jgi:hypothetical protein
MHELIRHFFIELARQGVPGVAAIGTFFVLAPVWSNEVKFEQSPGEGVLGHLVTEHQALIGPDSWILAVIAAIAVFFAVGFIWEKLKS